MNERLFVAVPIHGRLNIVRQCVPQLASTLHLDDALALYDDGTPGGLPAEVSKHAVFHHRTDRSVGIEEQRRLHFFRFLRLIAEGHAFTHLYLTDSDAIHDVGWRARLLALQDKYDGRLVCGYNTTAHERIEGNTVTQYEDAVMRRYAPGISYLLTVRHAVIVANALPSLPRHWNWDWTVPGLLGYECIVSVPSVVEHIGAGGMHHPADAGLEGGDVALQPTEYLQHKRQDIVERLRNEVPHLQQA